jgi:hypothetical protein
MIGDFSAHAQDQPLKSTVARTSRASQGCRGEEQDGDEKQGESSHGAIMAKIRRFRWTVGPLFPYAHPTVRLDSPKRPVGGKIGA